MEKAEFKNTSPGVCGVVVIEPGEKPRGIPVKPGETVWLTEEEQIATANAPKRAEDNPFVNGTLTLVTEPKNLANRRPIGHSSVEQPPVPEEVQQLAEERKAADREAHEKLAKQQAEAEEERARQAAAATPQRLPSEETGVQIDPVGDGPKGERAQDEEVGTPTPAPKPAAKSAKPKPVPTT